MEIKVFLNSASSKPVFGRIVEDIPGLDIDYSLLVRSMKVLFGVGCIIEFRVV